MKEKTYTAKETRSTKIPQGFVFYDISPLGEKPVFVIRPETKPEPLFTIFGYEEKAFLRRQYK